MLPNCDNSAAHTMPRSANPLRNRAVRPAFGHSIARPVDLNVEVPDFLPQRIAIETEKVGRPDLVTSGRRKRCREQRDLDLLEDAVIEPRRRYAVRKAREVRRQIG